MSPVDDWTLARRAATGDRTAFARIVRRYQQPVVAFCYRMTRSHADAEDIAQETFVRLYKALDRLQPERPFSTVLFTIARNAALNQLRGEGRHRRRVAALAQTQDQRDATAPPDRQAQAADVAVALETALAALTPEYREAFVLRECQGFEYRQIAAILSCPVGTVRSRIARAREQIRQQLLAYGDDIL